MTVKTDFWCGTCGDWMPVFIDSWDHSGTPYCNRCGEVFQCQECGYEIDRAGDCQRPEEECPTCDGNGEVERGVHQDRFSGVWETETGICDACGGTGKIHCPSTFKEEG